jgi:hypothetical protein
MHKTRGAFITPRSAVRSRPPLPNLQFLTASLNFTKIVLTVSSVLVYAGASSLGGASSHAARAPTEGRPYSLVRTLPNCQVSNFFRVELERIRMRFRNQQKRLFVCLGPGRIHHPTRAARAGTPVRSRFCICRPTINGQVASGSPPGPAIGLSLLHSASRQHSFPTTVQGF